MKKKMFQLTNKNHFINPDHIVEARWEPVSGRFTITLTTGKQIPLDESEGLYLKDIFDFERPL